jgi:hypothetical protein
MFAKHTLPFDVPAPARSEVEPQGQVSAVEVRNVLIKLSVEHLGGPCWCVLPVSDGHDNDCLAARALLEKLR